MAYLKSSGINRYSYPTGHVIQTVTASTTTETQAATTSYTAISGMTAAITPTYTTSKILILMHCGSMVEHVSNSLYVKITGTTTGDVQIQSRYGYLDISAGNWKPLPIAVAVFDTPGSVAAQTYALHLKNQTGTTASNWRVNSTEVGATISGTVILQEIKV